MRTINRKGLPDAFWLTDCPDGYPSAADTVEMQGLGYHLHYKKGCDVCWLKLGKKAGGITTIKFKEMYV
jgi:hypothetical protein